MPIISKNIKNILCSIRSERKNFTYLNSQFNLVCHEWSLKSQFCTVMLSEHTRTYVCLGLLPPEKFGEGVRPALQFCYLFKTCDCPYSWPHQKFETRTVESYLVISPLVQTDVKTIVKSFCWLSLIDIDEQVASS